MTSGAWYGRGNDKFESLNIGQPVYDCFAIDAVEADFLFNLTVKMGNIFNVIDTIRDLPGPSRAAHVIRPKCSR